MAENGEAKEIQLLLAGFLELKTRKEKERININKTKIDIQWRELMREAKSKELKEDLMQMKKSFSRAIDYKDSIITALENELEQTEVQNMWTACNHMQSLDQLIAIEHKRSQHLQQEYENDVLELKTSFKEMKEEVENSFKSEMLHFKDLNFIEETVFQNVSKKSKTEFILMQEDIHEEAMKEKADILKVFDCDIIVTWKQFQSTLHKYLEDAFATEGDFAETKKEYCALIEDTMHDRKITEELRKSIPYLKAQLIQREKDHQEKLQEGTSGHDDFYANVAELKDTMMKVQKADLQSLTHLIVDTNIAIKKLKRLESKGTSIMRLYKRCQTLEKEAELFKMSEEDSFLTAQENSIVEQNLKFDTDEDYMYVGALQYLWEKVNKVVLQNLALEREIEDLRILQIKVQSRMSEFFKQVAAKDGTRGTGDFAPKSKPIIQEAALIMKNKKS